MMTMRGRLYIIRSNFQIYYELCCPSRFRSFIFGFVVGLYLIMLLYANAFSSIFISCNWYYVVDSWHFSSCFIRVKICFLTGLYRLLNWCRYNNHFP